MYDIDYEDYVNIFMYDTEIVGAKLEDFVTSCQVIVGNIHVYGTDAADHDRNMKIVLYRKRDIFLRPNENKRGSTSL